MWVMLLAVLTAAALTACGGSVEKPPQSATEPTADAPAAEPTPSSTPELAPTATPTPAPTPEPVSFSGVGDDLTSSFRVASGVFVLSAEHDGDANFAIEILSVKGGVKTYQRGGAKLYH